MQGNHARFSVQCSSTQGRRSLFFDLLVIAFELLIGCSNLIAQQAPLPDAPQPQTPSPQPVPTQPDDSRSQYEKHHILWIIPNYRSDESTSEFVPLTARQKFGVAFDDSFDPTAFLVAGVFAGTAMAQDQYRSFGQGTAGFGKYYGGAFADQAIGNMMTEALLPIVLHQDPRYSPKGGVDFSNAQAMPSAGRSSPGTMTAATTSTLLSFSATRLLLGSLTRITRLPTEALEIRSTNGANKLASTPDSTS